MTKHEFLNRLRSLHCLDYEDDGDTLGMTAQQYTQFLNDPARFMMRCDDETADRIWAAIEARQTKEGV